MSALRPAWGEGDLATIFTVNVRYASQGSHDMPNRVTPVSKTLLKPLAGLSVSCSKGAVSFSMQNDWGSADFEFDALRSGLHLADESDRNGNSRKPPAQCRKI